MTTIRDVVDTLGQRDGVDTVIVLGRDGLPIVSAARNGVDADGLAALVPLVVDACAELGRARTWGEFSASVVEYESGLAVLTGINAETLLAIFVQPNTNIGPLLFELQQQRPTMADLL